MKEESGNPQLEEPDQVDIRLEHATMLDANQRVAKAFSLILRAAGRSKEGRVYNETDAQELKAVEKGTDQGSEASRASPKDPR